MLRPIACVGFLVVASALGCSSAPGDKSPAEDSGQRTPGSDGGSRMGVDGALPTEDATSTDAAPPSIDATMNDLRELFEHRAILVRELDGTKTVAANLILRMLQKFGSTCAARAAGLHNFIAIEPVQLNQVRPLAASNVVFRTELSAPGREQAEKEVA